MSPALNRLLLRLGRWPRRLAVIVCLLLAASSALARHSSKADPPDPLARLKPGQVAVPVTLTQSGTDGLISAGAHVGLLSAHTLLADHLLVLHVSGVPPGGDGTSSILVAADRPTALRIAKSTGQSILAVLDKSP